MEVILIDHAFEKYPLNEWYDDLLWCPSQCYYRTSRNGINYILYLRWRWDDPWTGRIFTEKQWQGDSLSTYPDDVFAKNHVQYSDEEMDMAKAKILELFWGEYVDGYNGVHK